jgi:hypothetical protein
MPVSRERIVVVLDEEYGHRLGAIAARVPVWVIDSATNRRAAVPLQERRAGGVGGGHEVVLCSFPGEVSAEERLLEMVGSVIDVDDDAAAGEFPYSILTVVGMKRTDAAAAALREYGLTSITRTADGFVATRPPD